MVILTRELASQMLDVYHRRLKDPRGTRYVSTVLAAAMGAPDYPLPIPNFIRKLRSQFHGGRLARRSDSEWMR